MASLKIIFGLIFSLVSLFMSVQLIRLYRRFKRADNATAKNIYIINYKDSEDSEDLNKIDEDMAAAEAAPRDPPAGQEKGAERRRHPRHDFQGFVDFIKEGILYKERARDLSFSGIFIQSKTPEKYKKNDFLVITFQTAQNGPQKKNGQIVRVDHTGIGVAFVP